MTAFEISQELGKGAVSFEERVSGMRGIKLHLEMQPTGTWEVTAILGDAFSERMCCRLTERWHRQSCRKLGQSAIRGQSILEEGQAVT